MIRKISLVISILGAFLVLILYLSHGDRGRLTSFPSPLVIKQVISACPSFEPGHIPGLKEIDRLKISQVYKAYHRYASNIEVKCKVMHRMGNVGDGGWEVCDDEGVRPANNCLVYSFGINNDFSFDDMISKYYGCEVHCFDPSMSSNDYRRSDKVWFHRLGIYGQDTRIHKTWPVKTLSSIQRDLGHTGRRIDVLKIDVEGSEWPSLDTILQDGSLDNVTQLLLETHDFQKVIPQRITQPVKILSKIRSLGFRIFYTHKNPWGVNLYQGDRYTPRLTCCHELHMIKIPSCTHKS